MSEITHRSSSLKGRIDEVRKSIVGDRRSEKDLLETIKFHYSVFLKILLHDSYTVEETLPPKLLDVVTEAADYIRDDILTKKESRSIKSKTSRAVSRAAKRSAVNPDHVHLDDSK